MQVLAAVALIAACTAMPWARYENRQSGQTTLFRGGVASLLLVALGVAAVALSIVRSTRRATMLRRLGFAMACGALVTCVVIALNKIRSANHAAGSQIGGSRTSYAHGAAVAIVASMAIALSGFLALRDDNASGEGYL